MWIKKEEYESLIRYNDDLKTQIEFCQSHISGLSFKLSVFDKRLKDAQEETDLHKRLLEEYKQKYADEVQKRLELIELYEKQS